MDGVVMDGMALMMARARRNHLPAVPSGPSFASWKTATPNDPTSFYATFTAALNVRKNDLILCTQFGVYPQIADGKALVTDSSGNTWVESANSKYSDSAGWTSDTIALYYAMASADNAALDVTVNAAANHFYPERGGCGLYVFRPPAGKKFVAGGGVINGSPYRKSYGITLPSTSAAGVVFLRAVGDETEPITFSSSLGTSIGGTNSQQTWTQSAYDEAGWAGYVFTSGPQSNLACTITTTDYTHISAAMDSFVLADA